MPTRTHRNIHYNTSKNINTTQDPKTLMLYDLNTSVSWMLRKENALEFSGSSLQDLVNQPLLTLKAYWAMVSITSLKGTLEVRVCPW